MDVVAAEDDDSEECDGCGGGGKDCWEYGYGVVKYWGTECVASRVY